MIQPPVHIPGLIPFACQYRKSGKTFAIVLYGDSEESVLENNCAELDDLEILGVMIGTIDWREQ